MLQKEKERLDEVSPVTQEKLYRVTPEDVLDLVTKLEDLKHYGPDVKRAMEEKIEKRDAITEEPYISYLNQYSHNKNKIKPRIEELEKQ
uniref:Uncharacterized protein n=1 Tax=Panagrolaimus davidi TaxID=227884 RepID=A0A914PXK2_9BILA